MLVSNKREESSKKIDSYTSVTGEYYFCVKNLEERDAHFTFNFFQGLEVQTGLRSCPI